MLPSGEHVYPGLPHPVLGAVRVVLVAPRVPANCGAVLRCAANFEAGGLVLVAPRCDPACDEVLRVAVDSPLLRSMRVVPSLREALADTHCSVGFTRRAGGGRLTHPSVRDLLADAPLLASSVFPPPATDGGPPAPTSALVFGREESGLEDSELSLCTYACAIPAGRAVPSLNLSHAVAVVLARLFELALDGQGGVEALDPERLRWQRQRLGQLATNGEAEALLQRAAALMEQAGVSAEETSGGGDKGNHGRKRLPAGHLRALLLRSGATVAEVRALHGVLKELERGTVAAGGPR